MVPSPQLPSCQTGASVPDAISSAFNATNVLPCCQGLASARSAASVLLAVGQHQGGPGALIEVQPLDHAQAVAQVGGGPWRKWSTRTGCRSESARPRSLSLTNWLCSLETVAQGLNRRVPAA